MDKFKNAKTSTWVTDGIPRWQVWLIIRFAKIKGRICHRRKHDIH